MIFLKLKPEVAIKEREVLRDFFDTIHSLSSLDNSVSDLKLINQTQNKLKIIFRGSELRCTCAKRTWGGPCELCQGSDNEIYSLRNFFRQIRNAKKHNMTPTEVQEFIKNTKKHVKAA
ncbi:MAG: hypothetical protein KA155_07395 [Alphaproteobacteria bacterium]|jgi:predicted methyltransferase|nr:hypothetical protein [Alphaproteobacteria bacterium]